MKTKQLKPYLVLWSTQALSALGSAFLMYDNAKMDVFTKKDVTDMRWSEDSCKLVLHSESEIHAL